jgi:hypothetical protein
MIHPLVLWYGFLCCTWSAGFDIGKVNTKKHEWVKHKISKDEAIKWFQQTYEGVILPGKTLFLFYFFMCH